MKNKKNAHDKIESQTKLTKEEIEQNKIETSTYSTEELQEFIYNISLVIYKAFCNEKH